MLLETLGRCAIACLALLPVFVRAEIANLEQTYQFLTTPRDGMLGALGRIEDGELANTPFPFSFFDTGGYWGEHVCQATGVDCNVIDVYDARDYTLTPRPGPAGDLQVERVNTHNGSNIYDSATWQIAVMLGAVKLGFAMAEPYRLASNHNRILQLPQKRALTAGKTFRYNGMVITEPARAYAFRMHSARHLATDPFVGTRFASLVRAEGLPPDNRDYSVGRISWTDWKPFTGENAWAFLLGPLHAAYIHHVLAEGGKFVPWDDPAIRNALAVLPTFAVMQSSVGGIYYAPTGTFANQGKRLANPYFVSVENSASVYAGLQVLRSTLEAQLAANTLTREQQTQAREALALIRIMLDGGTIQGRRSAGLKAFFRDAAWHDGEFVQGGYANDPSLNVAWQPVLSPKAVDANTWTLSALGPELIDRWFGFGAAFAVWERVKEWGGYGRGDVLLGVGFSDQDGNGRDARGFRAGVLSAEWTAGAINTVRRLLALYRKAHHEDAQRIVRTLEADERTMLEGVQSLRYERYVQSASPGKPKGYASLVPQKSQPYLYADRRAFVPFGWYANPLPSTCASAWMIMLASGYDPFRYGG